MIYIFLILMIFLFPSCEKDDIGVGQVDKAPSGSPYGVTRISDDSLLFVLQAPLKDNVYLIGDFTYWEKHPEFKMNKDGEKFWIKIGGLDPQKEYICQYLIDGKIRIADPYAKKISDPNNDSYISSAVYPNLPSYPFGKTSEIAMIVSTKKNDYNWKVKNFSIPQSDKLFIYELLIRDFTTEGTIKAATAKLDYLKALGVNAIELMPFNEFEGNISWGYNPSFYFATDKAYGTESDYKEFIDECHQRGMAVIMDLVLNHSFGQSPMVRMYRNADYSVSYENPWYNEKSNFENPEAQWGYDFNHESSYTKAFVDSVCSYWMREYKIDGYRFDFTKGFSNTPYPNSGSTSWGSPYDAARIANLKRIYDFIKSRKSDALMICEHLSDNSEEKVLANYGILLWGNMNPAFNEATMGWLSNSDLSWISYKKRGWGKSNLVGYMESHDEERIMFKNLAYGNSSGSYKVKDLPTALKRTGAAAAIMMSVPGPKMIWQFGELGYDYELNNDRLGKKPVRWDYYDDPDRKELYDVFAKLAKMKANNDIFSTSNYTIDFTGAIKYIQLNSAVKDAITIANFDVIAKSAKITLSRDATWKDYFGNDTFTGDKLDIKLEPGEFRIYFTE